MTNNVTEAGEMDDDEQAFRLAQMKNMFNNNLISVPGLNSRFQDDTPQNTQTNEFD